MAQAVFEIQGYAVVLDKICFVTRVFNADGDEGFQFNIRFSDKLVLPVKFPARHEAELQRGLIIEAIKNA
jgi:hypothetical protein